MKGLVLSSGGIDSTTCLAMAVRDLGKENVCSVIIHYGQRHSQEIESARKVADYYGVKSYEFSVEELFKYSNCSLMKNGQEVEESTYEEQFATGNKITSYVPFRNGLMLSICATLAQSLWETEPCKIYLGNHGSDYAYADCSPEFVKRMDRAINQGTYGLVHFESPLMNMTKDQVIAEGLKLGVPYELTYSCYEGGKLPCGKCASCLERLHAFKMNGVADPVTYKEM